MSHTASAPAAPTPAALARLAVLGAFIGLPTGLVAFVFITTVHELEHWLWDDLPHLLGADTPPWYLVVGLPVIGGFLAYLARKLPGDGGESPLHTGLGGGTPPPARMAWSVIGAALATLPFGLVLGPEAPLIALGMICGAWLTGWAKLPQSGRTLVGVSGSAAAMSTLFGGPLVAGLMILESAAGAGIPIVAVMVPTLSASAIAYTLITGLGTLTGLPMAGLSVPNLPDYGAVLIPDLLFAVVVGALSAVAAVLVRRFGGLVAAQEQRIGRLPLLVGGGLAVGLLALLAGALGANTQDVLFSGQSAMPNLVTQVSAWAVLVLLLSKTLGYLISLGAGFRGGPIFPAMFIGVALAQFGVIGFGMSPTAAIAIGAAAGMAAMTRMLLSPVLFAVLLTAHEGLNAVPLSVVGGLAAWLVASWLDVRLNPKAPAEVLP